MKFALVNGIKTEAVPGSKSRCQICDSELVAKCGEIRVHHWSHKGKRDCDPWWENESEWHRAWKNEFPVDWQEIVHHDENGEKHIADIKTKTDWVVEFQHSFLNPEERRIRNTFYKKLIWIVDGTRRKTDKKQFEKILKGCPIIIQNPPTIRVRFPDECKLLKEWVNSESLVFFDFDGITRNEKSLLWLLYPKSHSSITYLSYISSKAFIELSNQDGFEKLAREIIGPMHREILPMYEKKARYRN